MKTVEQLRIWGEKELEPLGPDESRASSERILMELTGLSKTGLYLEGREPVDEKTADRFHCLTARRKQRVPAAYLTGRAGFWEESLAVKPGCFIPRPETEVLIERFIRGSGYVTSDAFSFLDLGTGSGAIGIAILRHFPNAAGTLSDLSDMALETARENLEGYGLLGRAELIFSDLFEAFENRKWDVIFSNPPYFSEDDWDQLEPEIAFEPRMALDGGPDGLAFYRRIIGRAPDHLRGGGCLLLEAGTGQAGTVARWMEDRGFREARCFMDDLGIDRAVMGFWGRHG